MAVFVCTLHTFISYHKFTLSKSFVSLIFVVGWTNENILTLNFSQFMLTIVELYHELIIVHHKVVHISSSVFFCCTLKTLD